MANRQRQNWKMGLQIGLGAGALVVGGPIAYFAMVGGGILLNALFPVRAEKEQPLSESYDWRHTTNKSASHELPMPIVYGTAHVKPVVKNRFITIDGDKEYLNILYSFTGHRIDEKSAIDDVFTYQGNSIYPVGRIVKGNPNYTDYEPGKTYRAKKSFLSSNNSVNFHNYANWQVWHGTAKIDNILINGNPIDNYITDNTEDIFYETRPGLAEQSVIEGFDATYSNNAYSEGLFIAKPAIDVKGASIDYISLAAKVNFRNHKLNYNGTTYSILSDNLTAAGAINYVWWESPNLYYTLTGTSTPPSADHHLIVIVTDTNKKTYSQATNTPTSGDWFEPGLQITGAHDIEIFVNFPNGLFGIKNNTNVTNAYAYMFAQYREVGTTTWFDFNFLSHKPFATPRIIGDVKEGVIVAKKLSNFSVSVKAARITSGGTIYLNPTKTYEVRIAGHSYVIMTLTNIAGIVYSAENADGSAPGFSYPGESLLAIRALATGELSGDIEITGEVTRSTVKAYTGSAWVDKDANVHAWAVYDILANGHVDHPEYPDITAPSATIQPVYGCALSKDRIDYDSFNTWAQHTEVGGELELQLNIVFDTFTMAWDAIMKICREGMGVAYPLGSKFFAITDKAVVDADITQLFSEGNINLQSFNQNWVDKSKKANSVETTFWNADNNYERTQFILRTSDWDTGGELNAPIQLMLYGTTDYNQAVALATYYMNNNELLNQLMTFEMDVDALDSQVGDVVFIQHNSLTGNGGKVLGYNAGTGVETLDKTITLVGGTNYDFYIQHGDGTIDIKTDITGGVPTNTIDFGAGVSWTTNPAAFDNWAFGSAGNAVKRFRIVDIDNSGNYKRQVTCLEYNELAYKIQIGKADSSDLNIVSAAKIAPVLDQQDMPTFNTASNLRLIEVLSFNRNTGQYESSIQVSWDANQGEDWGEWEIKFRDVDSEDEQWQGEWDSGATYDLYDKVELNGRAYISLADANTSTPFTR